MHVKKPIRNSDVKKVIKSENVAYCVVQLTLNFPLHFRALSYHPS